MAICEPVEVDDDGGIFGRQRINVSDLHTYGHRNGMRQLQGIDQ